MVPKVGRQTGRARGGHAEPLPAASPSGLLPRAASCAMNRCSTPLSRFWMQTKGWSPLASERMPASWREALEEASSRAA